MTFLRRIGGTIACLVVAGVLAPLLLGVGATAQQEKGAAIAQGFQTRESNLSTGALLSLEAKNANYVELASVDNTDRLVGVVGEQALIELTSQGQEAQVVTSGVSLVLVSDINGVVGNGDHIVPSPISGIGMKATENGMAVAVAQASMASPGITSSQRDITTKDGKAYTVKVAAIPAQVGVHMYTDPDGDSSFIPEALQLFANSISGHEVSPVRVAIAALLIMLALVSIGSLMYSSVRSSILSVGRNPLAASAVRKSLLQVTLLIFGILLLAVLAIYLILIT